MVRVVHDNFNFDTHCKFLKTLEWIILSTNRPDRVVLVLGSLNPDLQISGKFVRPFYWETHPSKNHEYLFSFFKKPVVS